AAWRMVAPAVAHPRHYPRLVVGDPVADAVAEPAGDGLHEGRVGIDDVAGRPPAGRLENLRRIPVEQRRVWRDPVAEQLVREPVVVVEAFLVDLAAAVRDDARPRDREAKRVQAELTHERDVLAVPVVEVAGDCTRVAVPDLAGCGAESVPDAFAATVFIDGAFGLVRRGRRTPHEIARKRPSELVRHGCPLGWLMTGR